MYILAENVAFFFFLRVSVLFCILLYIFYRATTFELYTLIISLRFIFTAAREGEYLYIFGVVVYKDQIFSTTLFFFFSITLGWSSCSSTGPILWSTICVWAGHQWPRKTWMSRLRRPMCIWCWPKLYAASLENIESSHISRELENS